MRAWREFINGRGLQPERIENSVLLVDGVGKEMVVRHDLVPLRDFVIVNEKNWRVLELYYGGSPRVGVEECVPREDPKYAGLLNSIEEYKRQFIVAELKMQVVNYGILN
ncbi:hypothetical protein HDU98_010358 [Podochytrium sp. JEL0797]|nr:hypothetical protein HDU98_010355 [Podochytrium sp. JEL0797]KAJ3074768.1 hypothetical protein HDU98_010358 [Podochytrium sp. JEL0797]